MELEQQWWGNGFGSSILGKMEKGVDWRGKAKDECGYNLGNFHGLKIQRSMCFDAKVRIQTLQCIVCLIAQHVYQILVAS
ncbi:hypothetical protein UY3_04233 [Chelonia mydas]|uniref:Uncharacterized protein n=1 Tax=Chelonia mydas TaxID=8469 RepID=M7C2D0_CHEMY|nr:hypothetical protein UY3_04233 [Chelonia mydas]